MLWKIQMIARICTNGNSHILWWDYKLIQIYWGRILDYHAKVEHLHPLKCSHSLPGMFSRQTPKPRHQEAGTWIYSSTGYNSGKLETSKVSITRRRE